jgi:hypothetical protein
MTTELVSRITTTGQRFGPTWPQASGSNPMSAPAADSEHQLAVLSHHHTSEGVVPIVNSPVATGW